jgi:hypothetical protein
MLGLYSPSAILIETVEWAWLGIVYVVDLACFWKVITTYCRQ